MRDLDIQTVANGWIVKTRFNGLDRDPNTVFVFSTPAQLTLWIEKWSVERRKEQTVK